MNHGPGQPSQHLIASSLPADNDVLAYHANGAIDVLKSHKICRGRYVFNVSTASCTSGLSPIPYEGCHTVIDAPLFAYTLLAHLLTPSQEAGFSVASGVALET